MQLADYFEGYHTFVDKMCRYGLNLDQVPYIIIEISEYACSFTCFVSNDCNKKQKHPSRWIKM